MDHNQFQGNNGQNSIQQPTDMNSVNPVSIDGEAEAKAAKQGLIIGIISIVLNLIFCCIPFLTDWVFSPGYLFIILEAFGIKSSIQGKQSTDKRGMAIAGMVLNIISVVWSVLLIILVLVLKFSGLSD